jgi:hypothetical protein
LKWRRCENQAGVIHAEPAEGEAGGYFVEADGFARRAYLKPVKAHADARTHARAGREKIAERQEPRYPLCRESHKTCPNKTRTEGSMNS